MRLIGIFVTLTAALALAAGESATRAVRAPRPNVVLIVTDDQDTGAWTSCPVSTACSPSRATFTNAFVTAPQCCPSHVSILSGRYPHNSGVLNNWYPTGGFRRFLEVGARLDPRHRLQAAGYRTARFGKYLTEYEATTHVPPGWSEWYAFYGSGKYFNYQLNENGTQVFYDSVADDYSVDVLAGKVVDFIDRAPDHEPLFVFFAPAAPHGDNVPNGPARPAPRHRGMFAGASAPGRPRSTRLTSVTSHPQSAACSC
jgi:arylsulfatase A-like enzyme